MKKLALILIVLVTIVAGALFWLRGNLDGLVKNAISHYGSDMTRASVKVGSVEIRAKDGQGFIRNLRIGNPAGFNTTHALEVGEIEVAIDMASVLRDVVVIHKISIKAPDVIYEKGDAMTNFDALQKNIAAYLGDSKKSDSGGKKLIVEELTITNAKAQASAPFLQGKTVSVPLPDITMRNLGKAKGGLPPGELGQEVVQALKQKLTGAISFDNLSKSVGGAVEKATDAIKGLFSK